MYVVLQLFVLLVLPYVSQRWFSKASPKSFARPESSASTGSLWRREHHAAGEAGDIACHSPTDIKTKALKGHLLDQHQWPVSSRATTAKAQQGRLSRCIRAIDVVDSTLRAKLPVPQPDFRPALPAVSETPTLAEAIRCDMHAAAAGMHLPWVGALNYASSPASRSPMRAAKVALNASGIAANAKVAKAAMVKARVTPVVTTNICASSHRDDTLPWPQSSKSLPVGGAHTRMMQAHERAMRRAQRAMHQA